MSGDTIKGEGSFATVGQGALLNTAGLSPYDATVAILVAAAGAGQRVDALVYSVDDLFSALSGLGGESGAEEPAPSGGTFEPAVSVRKSLASKDVILSLIDGKPYKTLRRHLVGAVVVKAPAIAGIIAKGGAGVKPSDADQVAALEEAFDLVLGFFSNVQRIADAVSNLGETLDGDVARIADAAKTLAECVDDNCQPALIVKALVETAPADEGN